MPNVAALTLVRDTPDLIEAMRRQLPAVGVVDNGSLTPVPGAWLQLKDNRYFSGGWNAAMRELGWQWGVEWAWMLNSDVCGASPAMLADLLREAERTGAMVASPRIEPCRHRQMQVTETIETPWIDWVGPLVNVRWFNEVGGFDEQLPGWGADIDLCYRAAGKKLVAGRLVLGHAWGTTARRLEDVTMYRLAEAREYLLKKHGLAIRDFAPSFWEL